MRFITDVMLGRLSRWLRLLGFDTRSDLLDDEDLLGGAKADPRILLTRDKALIDKAQRRNIDCIYVAPPDLKHQIVEIYSYLGQKRIELDPEKSRCPLCNGELEMIPGQDLEGQVPPKVLQYHSDFFKCGNCTKIYWMGRHWENIKKKINDANSLLAKDTG